MKTLKIDIVSDVVCPWCAIGYAHLSQALKSLEDSIHADIHWHAFELNPHMGPDGQEINEHLTEKYGISEQQLAENKQRISDIGKASGIEFNFDARSRIYNTFDCHKLLIWAGEQGKQTQLKEALFKAYFGKGENVSDRELLKSIAESVGLSAQEADRVLHDEAYAEKVREEQKTYHAMGINAVPAVIINDKYMINGGQPVESFRQAFQEIAAETVSSD